MRKLPTLLIFSSLLFQANTLKGQQCYLDGRECEYYIRTTGPGAPIISYCDSIPCTGSLKIINADSSYSVHQKSNGKNEGAGIEYYPNGQIKYLANYHANYPSGLVTKFYENGRLESTEYFPPAHLGIWIGIDGQSFYPNGQLKEYWSYQLDPNWTPCFHYFFEENGDTLGKILPSSQDSSLFIETEYSKGKASNTRRFYIDRSGERKYLSAASKVHSSDILHFWEAYDLIMAESDSLKQIAILDSLYLSRASIGLNKIREVRNYQASEYRLVSLFTGANARAQPLKQE